MTLDTSNTPDPNAPSQSRINMPTAPQDSGEPTQTDKTSRELEDIIDKHLVMNDNIFNLEFDEIVDEIEALIDRQVVEELQLLQQIDFSDDEPDEIPSMGLDTYLIDRIATLQANIKHREG